MNQYIISLEHLGKKKNKENMTDVIFGSLSNTFSINIDNS